MENTPASGRIYRLNCHMSAKGVSRQFDRLGPFRYPSQLAGTYFRDWRITGVTAEARRERPSPGFFRPLVSIALGMSLFVPQMPQIYLRRTTMPEITKATPAPVADAPTAVLCSCSHDGPQ